MVLLEKGSVDNNGQMEQCKCEYLDESNFLAMRVTGKMIKLKDMVSCSIRMETIFQENGKMIKPTAMEYLLRKVVHVMKEDGRMMFKTD